MNQACDQATSLKKGFTLDQCKKLCDDEADCEYFSIGTSLRCKTHPSCQFKVIDASRTIYKKKDGSGKLLINIQF